MRRVADSAHITQAEYRSLLKSGKAATKPRNQLEHLEQVSLMQWRDLNLRRWPELEMLIAIPNGGLRNVTVAKKLKAEGLRAGVSDLWLSIPRRTETRIYHGLYVEMKSLSGKVSESQAEWLEKVIRYGYAGHVCYGWVEASEMIVRYLEMEP